MYKYFLNTAVICFLIFSACTEKNQSTKKIPTPGQNTFPQIFVVKTNLKQTNNPWTFPQINKLTEGLQVHAEEIVVNSLEEATEQFNVLNARPVDVLILEPGLVQEAWLKSSLPRETRRMILVFQPLNSKLWKDDNRVKILTVDTKAVLRFAKSFCLHEWSFGKGKKGCQFIATDEFKKAYGKELSLIENKDSEFLLSIGESRDRTFDDKPVHMSVFPNWPELLRRVLRDRSAQRLSAEYAFDISSSFLELRYGMGLLEGSKQRQEAETFMKLWSLSELRR